MLNGIAASKIKLPDRRAILRGAAVAGLSAGLGFPRVARAVTRRLKISYTVSQNSELGAETFSRRVAEATDGAWQVEYTPGVIFGGEREMLEAVRRGDLDLMVCSAVALSSIAPEFGVFDLPFLFTDAAHARAALDSAVGDEYLNLFTALDVIALAWGENGVRHLTNSRHRVRSVDDLQGLRLRLPESEVTMRCFRQLGAEVASLAFPALYGALESGRFDGEENPIPTILSSHFERVQRYLTLTGHVYSSSIFFVSKDVWDDLGNAERNAFRRSGRAGGQTMRVYAAHLDKEGVKTLRQAGMDVVERIDQDAFLAKLEPVWSDLASQFGTEQIARLRAVQPANAG